MNGGKCGICGDPFDSPQPRPHELGGLYGIGHIVARYEPGQIINTDIILSATHQGFWELRLCSDPNNQNQECFDRHLLQLEDGGTKYYPRGEGSYNLKYRLPIGVTCDHCVLQWRYTAGNNWGICSNGSGSLGCGNQEQFFSCSDVSILERSRSSVSENDSKVTGRLVVIPSLE